jgi:hypothetical protein
MAPWKMMKNPDAAGEDSNPNTDILSDTTPRAMDTVKSWTQVFEVLEQEIINCPEDSAEEEDDTYAAKLRHIAQSELHKIAARPRLMPYNDMISWALEHVDIQTRSIVNHQKVVVGSFQPEHMQVMYKLSPNPKYTFNVAFILEFEQKECISMPGTVPI